MVHMAICDILTVQVAEMRFLKVMILMFSRSFKLQRP